MAYQGLAKAGIPEKEAEKYLSIIQQRVKTEKTGSQWILDSVEQLRKNNTIADAMIITTAGFLKRQKENIPVHLWAPIAEEEIVDKSWRFQSVDQIMSRDLFGVQLNDPITYAAHIMSWRRINHLLVRNENGKLEGLLTANNLLPYVKKDAHDVLVKDVMITEPVKVEPTTSIAEALDVMLRHNIDSLPIVEGEVRVVGLITITDLIKATAFFLHQI